MAKKLAPKHAQFVEEYIANHFNATQAYFKLYGPDLTYGAARTGASVLMGRQDVQDYLQARMGDVHMPQEEVLALLAAIARDGSVPRVQIRALELVGRTHGLFKDTLDLTSKGERISWADFVARAKDANKS